MTARGVRGPGSAHGVARAPGTQPTRGAGDSPSHPTHQIRPIAEADWPGIAALESRTYAPLGLSEGEAALRSRARLSPGTCAVLDHAGAPAGYVVALPYPPFRCPDLAAVEGGDGDAAGADTEAAGTEADAARRPGPARNLHLHDLVIAPEHRGRGLAARLLRQVWASARAAGYERISLVAVGGSAPFWAGQGFGPRPEVPLPDSYGTDAHYMSAPVPASRTHPPDPPPPGPGIDPIDEDEVDG
ncbi:GNAT family N-acetyltransferase [Streptomyces sp. 796.1]|uniref:GNAT family N-acetyltransferase n=1 Tax=Streptomyces sp. 796.1 TaxID=3163029 RepID=UPI0039C98D17